MGANTLFAVPCASDNPVGVTYSICGPVDTIIDFTAAGMFDDGATLSGTLDIDITSGSVTYGDLSIAGGDIGSTPETFAGSPSPAGSFANNTTWAGVQFESGDSDYQLTLDIDLSQQSNTSSLQGYSGGNLCFANLPDETTGNCTNAQGGYFVSSYSYNGPPIGQLGELPGDPNLVSGTLATPEPSSFLLMAVPGLWFGIRRIRRRA